MAPEGKWVAFDNNEDDDKLSLCDFPLVVAGEEKNKPGNKQEESDPTAAAAAGEDFEFRTCGIGGRLQDAAEADMCAADEVFFQGQILPLRPSVSSDCGLLPASCGPSRSGSRSDSMDRFSSAAASLGFTSSRSSSTSSRSSGSISRCQSSSSFSGAVDAPRLSLSNNFYAHPSPSPQVRRPRSSTAGRKSTGSSPPSWELFRLGVVKAPEIELHNLRPRRINHDTNDGKSSTNNGCQIEAKVENRVMRFLGRGFGCKCSPDSINGARQGLSIPTKKAAERSSSKRGESVGHGGGRMLKWLEELTVAKESMGSTSILH